LEEGGTTNYCGRVLRFRKDYSSTKFIGGHVWRRIGTYFHSNRYRIGILDIFQEEEAIKFLGRCKPVTGFIPGG